METPINVTPVKTVETKKCKCCGKELPLSEFHKKGIGYRNICISCEHRENGASERFKDVTSRQLIDELIARGYKGSLKKEIIETVNL